MPLDMLVAIYHRRSGITHIVDPATPVLLEEIGGDWIAADAIFARLDDRYDLAQGDPEALTARLSALVEAGLVEMWPAGAPPLAPR